MYDDQSGERDYGDDASNKQDHIAIMKDVWNYDLEVIKTIAEICVSYIIDLIFQSTFHYTISMIYQTILTIYMITKVNKMLNFPHIIVINGKNLNPSDILPYYLAYKGLGYDFEVVTKVFDSKFTKEIKEMLWQGNSQYITRILADTGILQNTGDIKDRYIDAEYIRFVVMNGHHYEKYSTIGAQVNKLFEDIREIVGHNSPSRDKAYAIYRQTMPSVLFEILEIIKKGEYKDISENYFITEKTRESIITQCLHSLNDSRRELFKELIEENIEQRYSESKFVTALMNKKETVQLGRAFQKWFDYNNTKYDPDEYTIETFEQYHLNKVDDYEKTLIDLMSQSETITDHASSDLVINSFKNKGIQSVIDEFGTSLPNGHYYNIETYISTFKKVEQKNIIDVDTDESINNESDEYEEESESNDDGSNETLDELIAENNSITFWVVYSRKEGFKSGLTGVSLSEGRAEDIKNATCLIDGYHSEIVKITLTENIPKTKSEAYLYFENKLMEENKKVI